MEIVTTDYTQLINLRDAIVTHDKIKIEKISKETFPQDFLDNIFLQDLNSDKVITSEEYEITWGWLAQGKPENVAVFIENASVVPAVSTIPTISDKPYSSFTKQTGTTTLEVSYEGCSYDAYYKYGDINQTGNGVNSDDTNVALNILIGEVEHPEQSTLEFALSNINQTENFTGISFSELLKIDCVAQSKIEATEYLVPATTDLSSDWNMDGEVDELDLLILERFVLTQPATLEEYNKDRGEYPLAKCLPDLTTAKYQCPVYREECHQTPTPTPSVIANNSVRIKDCCVTDGELDISVEYNIETSTNLFIHLKPGEFGVGKTFSGVESGVHTLQHKFENLNFEVTQVVVFLTDAGWADRIDSDILNEIPNCATPTPTPSLDCSEPHPDDLQIDYGDYLIFKRWLELEKTLRLDIFNRNRDYAPQACRLPYNKYDDIGTSTYTFKEVYDGIENL
jgi:hypothetical protein